MNVSAFCAALVMALAPSRAATAGLMPVSGTQSSTGKVSLWMFPDVTAEDSYSIEAADPLASWAPPDQHIKVEATSGWRQAEASIGSSFASTILSGRVTLATDAVGYPESHDDLEGHGYYEYRQTFHLTFELDAPMGVMLSAEISRWSVWHQPNAVTLSFGRTGDAPIIDLLIPPNKEMYDQQFALTYVILVPGTYTVLLDDTSANGYDGRYIDFSRFDLRAVPAPGCVLGIGIGLITATSRRRFER